MTKSKTRTSAQLSTLRRVLAYTAHARLYIVLSLVFAVVSVALTLYLPVLTGDAVDLIIGAGQVDFDALLIIFTRMAIVILLTAASQWIMAVCNNRITFQTVRDIRQDAFRHLQRLPLKYIDAHPSGDVVSRIIADVDTFADGLLMGFTQLFTGVMTILITLIFMLRISVGTTIVVVFVTPLSLFVAAFIAKRTYSMFHLQSSIRGEQTALINEMIGGQKVVQAFGRERAVLERFDEINDRLQGASLRATFFSSLTNPCTRFVNALVYAGVAIFGALSAVTSYMTIGQLTCFLTYANQYTKPFNEISGVVTELQNAIACAARIFELMDEPAESPDDVKLEEEADGEQADESDEAFSAGALWPVLLTIVVLVLAGFGIQYVEITLALCLVCYVLRYYRTTAFACAVLCVRRVLDVILLVMQSGSWLEIALDVISAAAFLALTYAAMRTYIVHRHEDEDKAEE